MTPHSREIERIKRLVAQVNGCFHDRANNVVVNVLPQAQRLYGSAGIPDLYVQMPRDSEVFWFEVKVGRDKPSPAQQAFSERERSAGGVGTIVGNLGSFVDFLLQYEWTPAQRAILLASKEAT